jgi:hypothetical protein
MLCRQIAVVVRFGGGNVAVDEIAAMHVPNSVERRGIFSLLTAPHHNVSELMGLKRDGLVLEKRMSPGAKINRCVPVFFQTKTSGRTIPEQADG